MRFRANRTCAGYARHPGGYLSPTETH